MQSKFSLVISVMYMFFLKLTSLKNVISYMNIKLVADGIKHPSEDITEFGSLIVECNFFCRYKSMSVIVCLTFTKHNFVIVVIHEENFTICKITPYSK